MSGKIILTHSHFETKAMVIQSNDLPACLVKHAFPPSRALLGSAFVGWLQGFLAVSQYPLVTS